MCIETQKMPNSQNNLKKEEQSWSLTSNYTAKLQYSKHYDTGTQTHRSMEHTKEPRNKPLHLWSINYEKEDKNTIMKKRQSLQ